MAIELSRLSIRVKASFTYVVANYSNLYQRMYESTAFSPPTNDAIRFHLVCLPRGLPNYWDESHVVVHLWADQSDRDSLPLKYRLAILDARGDRHNCQEGHAEFMVGKKDNHRVKQSWQYLLSRQYLAENAAQLLPADKLTLLCEVDVLDQHNQTPINYDQLKQTKVSQDMQSLMDSGKFADVHLVVGQKEFAAHKAILTARSGLFAAMFEQPMKEAHENRVEITDMDAEVFVELLRYIYTVATPALDRFDSQLLSAADKYQLDCLKSICEQSLLSKLSIDSAASVLLLADMHNATTLKTKCIAFITDHAVQVMTTESWQVMTNARPELAVQLYQDYRKISNKRRIQTSAAFV